MLTVAVKLTLGSRVYDQHAASVRLRRGLAPIVDRLEITLPAGADVTAAPGDPALLDLDGGDGPVTVFTGEISGLSRSLGSIRVTAHDGGQALARYRPAMTLEQLTVGAIVGQLCGDAGVATGSLDDGPKLTLYVADGRSTALGEAARLGRLFGASAVFDGDGKLHLFGSPDQGPVAAVALLYGREILALDVDRRAADPASRTVIGEGAGAPGSDQARWPISDFYGGGADAPGPSARRRAEPELRTVDDARAASGAWAARQAALEAPARMRTWLVPGLAPGGRVELQQVPASVGLSAILVRQVVHAVDPARGAFTEVWGSEDTGGGGGGGLLGAAASALGSVL